MQHFIVTTKHPNGWQDGEHEFRVNESRDGFSASCMQPFGCSRYYATPEKAIRALCADNACHVLSIREISK